MSSCLGIYIEPHIIKYAKISKDHENIAVESFGIKFYEKLGEAINQIVSETYSYKTPISLNLSEESYQYFYMFTLLNNTDLRKAIQTEFDAFCSEKGINRNSLETRYVLVNSAEDKEKVKVIHITANKTSLVNLEQPFVEYKVNTVVPMTTAISNIANLRAKENVLIVNMEAQTTITTIAEGKIYQVDKLDAGSTDVLEPISIKENSYSKAYEICKNSTIYTMEGQDLQEEENEYLENIMPTLYKIATHVKDIITNSTLKIEKVYLTGTLSVINNIDLYFQEVLVMEKCEILKPFFIRDSVKVNIKDYVEVNSAMALALQGLGYGIKDVNFKKQSLKNEVENLFAKLNIEVTPSKKTTTNNSKVNEQFSKISQSLSGLFKNDFREKINNTERWLLRCLGGMIILVVAYFGFSTFISSTIEQKNSELAEVKSDTSMQIAKIQSDTQKVKSKTSEYESMTQNLKNISEEVSEILNSRNNIPDLLSYIMVDMPKGVQITSIENTTGKHIVINVQAKKYEQLGYFKTILKTKGILTPDSVVSSTGEKQGDLVKVVIEGDMP